MDAVRQILTETVNVHGGKTPCLTLRLRRTWSYLRGGRMVDAVPVFGRFFDASP